MRPAKIVTAALAGACVFSFLLMAFDRDPPFTLSNGNTVPPEITPGEVFRNRWNIDFRRRCEGTVTRYIIDSKNHVYTFATLPSRFGVLASKPFKGVTIGAELMTPEHTAEGPARLYTRMTFVCNPLHYLWPITYDAPVINIKILKSKSKI